MGVRTSRRERERLDEICRSQCGEARLYRRARMVLLATAGESVASIARQLGTNRTRVTTWLRRFGKERVHGLEDVQRPGRPIKITSLERHQVVAAACQSPTSLDCSRHTWTHEALAMALMAKHLVREISASQVGRILDEAEIRPHRVKMWCHSKDPEFQTKLRAIVTLYCTRIRREPVLCIDEKTGMQALSRSRDLQSARPGHSARFDFEYKRHGTRCLFACFNVATGRVLGRCTASRKRPDFFAFMDWVAAVYRQRRVHVVLDNLNTHLDTSKGSFISDWNRRHGNRFVFHYTPTHGSWLNQIELWFGIVSRRVLRYGNFKSLDELIAAVEAFVDEWNKTEAHPFRWTYEGHPLVA